MLLALLSLLSPSFAQDVVPALHRNVATAPPPLHHAVIVEFLGTSGGFGSHYELGIGSFHARGGLGIMPCMFFCSGVMAIPNVGVSYTTGPRVAHHLELAGGAMLAVGGGGFFLHPSLGYRFEKATGGLLFRGGLGMLYSMEARQVVPWLNLGLGYSFPTD